MCIRDSHSCVVLSDGVAKCWGLGTDGQLGNGSDISTGAAVSVSHITTAVNIGAGNVHTCAVLANGSVWCWGSNFGGFLLGTGNADASSIPVQALDISTAVEVSVGNFHSCALLLGGRIRCWGYNFSGYLGVGTLEHSATPVLVNGVTTCLLNTSPSPRDRTRSRMPSSA